MKNYLVTKYQKKINALFHEIQNRLATTLTLKVTSHQLNNGELIIQKNSSISRCNMKLLSLNIRQGGGTRIASISDYLVTQDRDAVVISEFRCNAVGHKLIATLRQAGYSHFHHTNTEPRQNTVMVATKLPSTPIAITGCTFQCGCKVLNRC